MAGSDAGRIVLLYGPSGDGWADWLLKVLPPRWGATLKTFDGSGTVPSRLARFAALRMQGETLVAGETRAECVVPLADSLRDTGAAEFFVLDPDFLAGDESEVEWHGPSILRRRKILARMRECKLALDAAHAGLTEAVRTGRHVTEAARWILDNAWLIRAGINELRKNLPSKAFPAASGRQETDIYRMAQNLAATADFAVDEDNIRTCLQQMQRAHALTIGELWAFPLFLRVVLIEVLAVKATRESDSEQLRERARLWANRLATAMRTGRNAYARLLQRLECEPVAYRRDFAALLAEALQDNEAALSGLGHWAEERFGISLADLLRFEQTHESARTVSTANAYKSLRSLSHLEFAPVFESVSAVEAELQADPGGVYPRSDFETRDRCRREVERISLQSGVAEQEVARRALTLAAQSDDPHTAHVAWYLLADGIAEVEKTAGARIGPALRIRRWAVRNATPVYITAILLLTACFMAISLVLAWEAGVHSWMILAALAAVASFTLSELSLEIAHALIISLLPPEPLPRMDYRDGIPASKATLVVVPTMLTTRESIRTEIGKLEVRYLGNRNENIFFGLFSDFTDSPVAVDADDEALLRAAIDGINRLNARYPGGRFLLFHRPRTWSDSEHAWIGRERKRGKIEDLNAFLCGDDSLNLLLAGRLTAPVSYVITLDSDTQLPLDTARKLIETIAHPLNSVVIDPVTRVRTSGYAIIQPRISIALPTATATRFTRIFSDAHGTDPYCRTISDAQQDLFLEAIFHGKAIYDVKAFHRILQNRFPNETILSHDLIEGSHAGVGLASDIELFESMPLDYGSYAARQRRWIRGDWQVAPWMFRRVPLAGCGTGPTSLNIINRWRILDNLRRSLIPVAAVALLLFGWLISPVPGIASLVVALAVAIPAFAPILDRLARRVNGSVRGWQGAADDLKRAAVMIAFLPHQAWLAIDSIARVHYRRWFSHRGMLEWQTAEKVRTLGRQHLDAAFRQMLVISVLSVVLAFVLVERGVWARAIWFVALWVAAPLMMRWLAGPGQPKHESLSLDEKRYLRRTARKTWRYFDDLVTASTNWLPPDNSQLKFQVEVAPRTSPTNIGLWLVASLAARDFGYQTADEMCARCSRTMETLRRLERCDTHLLNWYDTRTLVPLTPRYVSTVDSGNLVAALWVFAQGCLDTLRAPVIGRRALRGLRDTIAVAQDACGSDQSTGALRELHKVFHAPQRGYDLVARLHRAAALCATQHSSDGDEAGHWTSRLKAQIAAWNETARRYLGWMETLASPPDSVLCEVGPEMVALRRAALNRIPSLKTIAGGRPASLDALLAHRHVSGLRQEIVTWFDRVAAEYAAAQSNAAEMIGRLGSLRTAAEDLSRSMDLSRFYDRIGRLFGIGYSAHDNRTFTSHYDLLASECRLTSLVAIAKGDVPVEHWFAMSRPWDHTRRHGVLLSWGGTMFEYLMPLLFTRTVANSLLDRACFSAVKSQIAYGRRKGIPWGISESAHGVLDSRRIYQYRAFGVPELALNPDIGNDPVVAPYATMLALSMFPGEAVANLHRLAQIGMSGPMGFYESVDFRGEENGSARGGEVVRCHMAHHQAMSLAALDNVLGRNIMQRRFHRDPRIRSVEALLCERVPILPMPSEERNLRQATERLVAGFHFNNEERFTTSPAVSN